MGILGKTKPASCTETVLYQVPSGKVCNLFIAAANIGVSSNKALWLDNLSLAFTNSVDVSPPKGMAFSSDGLKLYLVDYSNTAVLEYTLIKPYYLEGKTLTYTLDVSTQATYPVDISLRNSGQYLYLLDDGNDKLFRYSMSTPEDLSTATFDDGQEFALPTSTVHTAMHISSDGNKFYRADRDGESIYQYSFGTSYDVTTLSYDSISLTGLTSPGAIYIDSNLEYLYTIPTTTRVLTEYKMSTLGNISTAAATGKTYSMNSEDTDIGGLYLVESLGRFFASGGDNDSIYTYQVATPESAAKIYLQESGETLPTSQEEQVIEVDLASKDSFASVSYNLIAGERVIVESDTGTVSFNANGIERDE